MALMGNYETSSVYYQGVVQQIHKLLSTISDPTRKGKWQHVSKCVLMIKSCACVVWQERTIQFDEITFIL